MMRLGRGARLALLLSLSAGRLAAADGTPPPPEHYFDDRAGLVSKDDALRLDDKLRQFDEATSTQLVVSIFPELPSPSLEDFTIRTAQAWRVGRKKLDNGAILFVFVKDRKMRIEVGYGLEGSLTDLRSHQILDEQVAPFLRSGEPARALEAGIDGMIAVTRGEYQAPPERRSRGLDNFVSVGTIVLVVILLVTVPLLQRRAARRSIRAEGGDGAVGVAAAGAAALGAGAEEEAIGAAEAEVVSRAAGAPSAAVARRGAGEAMKLSTFRNQIDHDRIVAAIRAAEERSRGEIRVHVAHHSVGDAEAAAAAAFTRLGMTATAERNGVLIYVAPRSQRFAVLGDTAIHGRCGDAFWRSVSSAMEQAFREGRFTDGLVEAVATVGQALTREFPRVAGKRDENELPDAVSEE